jgi:hypothetical protein
MKINIFWGVTEYSLVERYQCFAGICCHHLQGRRMREVEIVLIKGWENWEWAKALPI